MRLSLLDIVQTILSDLNSDDVNNIGDTVESMQVATIVRTVYFNILDGRDWPHLYRLFQLESVNSLIKPTHMKLPDNVIDLDSLKFIKYDCRKQGETEPRYQEVKFLTPYEFLKMSDGRRTGDSRVQTVHDDSGVPIFILKSKAPQFYTCLDNTHILFDSYDESIDTTLHESKTQAYGKVQPVWQMVDDFIPDLPPNAFSYLLAEATSVCSLRLKELGDQKAEQNSITQKRRLSQEAWRVEKGIRLPDYGRKPYGPNRRWK